jgi:hypothetical protein
MGCRLQSTVNLLLKYAEIYYSVLRKTYKHTLKIPTFSVILESIRKFESYGH